MRHHVLRCLLRRSRRNLLVLRCTVVRSGLLRCVARGVLRSVLRGSRHTYKGTAPSARDLLSLLPVEFAPGEPWCTPG